MTKSPACRSTSLDLKKPEIRMRLPTYGAGSNWRVITPTAMSASTLILTAAGASLVRRVSGSRPGKQWPFPLVSGFSESLLMGTTSVPGCVLGTYGCQMDWADSTSGTKGFGAGRFMARVVGAVVGGGAVVAGVAGAAACVVGAVRADWTATAVAPSSAT